MYVYLRIKRLKMRKITTFLLLLLPATITWAADEKAADGGKGSNIGAILFVIGLIVFLIVVRRLYDARNKSSADKAAAKAGSIKKDNIYEPRFWYQCKNCKVTIRKDSMPNSADCFQAPDHIWTELAEVGTIKYLCKNCSTLIETRTVPVNQNCPEAAEHNWERLG